jgi:hypothetical protein
MAISQRQGVSELFIQLDEAQKKSLLELVKSFLKNDHEPHAANEP